MNRSSVPASTSKVKAAAKKQNTANADTLATEKTQSPTVITDTSAMEISRAATPTPQSKPAETPPQPSYDDYGPSTKLDRPDVHATSLALYQIYSKYLAALQAASANQRQAASNTYLSDNKASFGTTFFDTNSNSTDNLSLLLQSSSVKLPASINVGSIIVDPNDSTKVIAQMVMEPDVPWSLLVSTKTKDSLGNFGTIENIYVRQNRNPL